MIGTNSLVEQNQIHHVEVNDDLSGVRRIAIYDHPSEIWQIITSPHDSELLMTVYDNVTSFDASLWKIKENKKISEVTKLGEHNGKIQKIVWSLENSNSCMTIDSDNIRFWDLNDSKKEISLIKSNSISNFTTGCWNSYFKEQVITTSGSTIDIWDTKSKKSNSIEKAHTGYIRDIDINRNNPYYFVSGGDDGKIKFWDFRNTSGTVKEYSKHRHWICSVKYNTFKDSLLLSAGTDGIANLWNIHSLSFKNPSIETQSNIEDKLIHSYSDHEDSIYSITWSNNTDNPWLFASVSYDGRVIINRVPDNEVQRLTE